MEERGGDVPLGSVLSGDDGDVVPVPVGRSSELLDEVRLVDVDLEVLSVLGHLDLVSDDAMNPSHQYRVTMREWEDVRVEHGSEELPDTLEDPRSVVDEHDVERLGVVGLEALDDEEDAPPVHVTESEASHVKDHDDLVDGAGEERPVGLHLEDDKVLEGLGGLVERPVLGDVDVAVEQGRQERPRREETLGTNMTGRPYRSVPWV